MAERRIGNRLLCADMLELEWSAPAGVRHITTALLEDICEIGACLHVEVAVPEKTKVELRYHGVSMPAVVKYCNFREIGFYVGVEFRDGFVWSPRQFLPDHLLDLKNMAK